MQSAGLQSLQSVAWIWTTHPCDSSDQALKREERILMISVHGNISGGNSIPDIRNRKEWCEYTSIEMFLSFGPQQEYTLKWEQTREKEGTDEGMDIPVSLSMRSTLAGVYSSVYGPCLMFCPVCWCTQVYFIYPIKTPSCRRLQYKIYCVSLQPPDKPTMPV